MLNFYHIQSSFESWTFLCICHPTHPTNTSFSLPAANAAATAVKCSLSFSKCLVEKRGLIHNSKRLA